MTAHNIETNHAGGFALFHLGFRPFFLAAGVFSVIGMGVWMLQLVFSIPVIPSGMSPIFWHAHEMIYGYALAVIAGFLLTAVKNWTGIQTLHGLPLILLFSSWVLARIASLIPSEHALFAAVIMNHLFIVFLSIALTVPVIKAKRWKNMAVISKIYFILLGNIIYSLGLFGQLADGKRIGIYIGLYMILSLILVLSRKVIPMFIERGVDDAVSLKNYFWVDVSVFLFFLIFAIVDTFFHAPVLTASLAAALFVLHCIRLGGWYTRGIWKKPLLWMLYVAYMWIILGFGLKFAAFMAGIPTSLAIHAFTVGGIGMMTLGMITRVSLGHTGRSIMQPPSGLGWMFFMLFLSAFIRVLFPLLFDGHDMIWIGVSQMLWIATFLLFLYIYAPILIKPRMDGRWG